jgi:hypothetical protein
MYQAWYNTNNVKAARQRSIMPLRELPEESPEILEERRTADGRRRLQLNASERREIQQSRQIDEIILMMLDFENSWTYAEMAEELGISVASMKNLTRTEEFEKRYAEYYYDLGRDPRVKLTQARVAELLPTALLQLRKGLEDPDVPWTAKTKLIQEVFELSGIKKPESVQNDRKELEQFLLEKRNESGGQDNVTINIPTTYLDRLNEYRNEVDETEDEDVVEGEIREVESDVG